LRTAIFCQGYFIFPSASTFNIRKISYVLLFHLRNLEYVCTIDNIINQNRIEMAYKINDDCTACGTCIDECPVEAISEGDIYKIDPDVCTDCGACADVCPVEAIHPVE
jgi:ferredoxin